MGCGPDVALVPAAWRGVRVLEGTLWHSLTTCVCEEGEGVVVSGGVCCCMERSDSLCTRTSSAQLQDTHVVALTMCIGHPQQDQESSEQPGPGLPAAAKRHMNKVRVTWRCVLCPARCPVARAVLLRILCWCYLLLFKSSFLVQLPRASSLPSASTIICFNSLFHGCLTSHALPSASVARSEAGLI